MYCPVCGAEYRPGFTVCSDCQVALVSELPRASDSELSEGASFVAVWSGDDPLQHAEIVDALDRAEIPTRTFNREDRSFNLVVQPAFQVFVPAEFADSAREALKPIAAIEVSQAPGSEALEIPVEESAPEDDDYEDEEEHRRQRSRFLRARGQRLDPEDAGTEVWSGEDAAMANMIALSLRENEIPCRRDPDPTGSGAADSVGEREPPDHDSQAVTDETRNAVFVFPEDEPRAREIIREILSAAPPE